MDLILQIISLLGGLAIFLFGMNEMSASLERASGARLSAILEKLTHNALSGLLCGFFVTAIIQSSSATTVMVVGFVNAGILSLSGAVFVIMGANVGTTATSWILSLAGLEGNGLVTLLKPTSLGPLLAICGIVLFMAMKDQKKKDVGTIFLGLGMIFIGMNTMSDAMKPLTATPAFANILTLFTNPFLGVLAGAVITAVIQSSSASIGILQALSASGKINGHMALPIILGQNIGTCVTAVLSSAGANRNAKRAAAVHLIFNVVGTVLFLGIYLIAKALLPIPALDGFINETGIAVIHSVFNIGATLVLLPFSKLLVKASTLIIRDTPSAADEVYDLLDDRFLQNPAYALVQCNVTMAKMAEMTVDNVRRAIQLISDYNEEEFHAVEEQENTVDHIEDRIGTYAVKLTDQTLSFDESKTVSKILHAVGDFERVCDHSINIAEIARQANEKKIVFSEMAQNELALIREALNEMMDKTLAVYRQNDLETAKEIEPLEEVMDDVIAAMRDRHIERLKQGQCEVENGVLFLSLLTNMERVFDHCSNVALAVLELAKSRLESHEYTRTIHKGEDETYKKAFDAYQEKYFAPLFEAQK